MPQRSEPLEKEKDHDVMKDEELTPASHMGRGCSVPMLSQRQPDLKEEALQHAAVLIHDI